MYNGQQKIYHRKPANGKYDGKMEFRRQDGIKKQDGIKMELRREDGN